jgi:glycosyltransferase involved in cell wall biosynthesis
MKIVINGRGLIKRYTGIAVVTENLTFEMAKAYPDVEFILVLSDKTLEYPSEVLPKNLKISVLKEFGKKASGFSKVFFEQISFLNFCKKEKADIAFYPYPSNPWIKSKIFTAVIVHDAIPWKMNYSNGIFSSLYNRMSKRAVRNADLIFSVSKFSKKDISKYANVSEDLIKVVYNDASEEYKKAVDEDFSESVLKKLKIQKEKYFIYAGGYDERKNVKTLVHEFLKFSEKHKDIKLLLVGKNIFSTSLYSSFEDVKGAKNVKFSGNVSDMELHALYKNALALVHLSKEEGFNLPIVEAGNSDCALILSDIEINREIAGKGGLYVNLDKSDEAIDYMEKMLDEDFRDNARIQSRNVANQYLWERSALRYMDILLTNFKNDR